MSNIVPMPQKWPDIFGPKRLGNSVIIDGHRVPRLHAHNLGDTVEFVLDGRFGYTFPAEWAYLAASFAAQAMAIGAGYPHMGAKNRDRPFAPQVMEISVGDIDGASG